MAENGNVNLVLGKALSVLTEAELFEPVRNPLHRNSADFPSASTPAGGSVHILLAKDCSRSGVSAHVVQGQSRSFGGLGPTSGLPPTADSRMSSLEVREVPIAAV